MGVDDPEDPKTWFNMNDFIKSGRRIGLPPGPKQLPNIDIDSIPAPSPQGTTEENGHLAMHLAIRGWGVVVITEIGVRLLWRKDIGEAAIDAFGKPFP